MVTRLRDVGIDTVEALVAAPDAVLVSVRGISPARAEAFRESGRALMVDEPQAVPMVQSAVEPVPEKKPKKSKKDKKPAEKSAKDAKKKSEKDKKAKKPKKDAKDKASGGKRKKGKKG